jgi:hypothetical protein
MLNYRDSFVSFLYMDRFIVFMPTAAVAESNPARGTRRVTAVLILGMGVIVIGLCTASKKLGLLLMCYQCREEINGI